MNNQEAFDKMCQHLNELPARATIADQCTYNGPKCVVGALFTDEEQALFGDHEGVVVNLLYCMTDAGHVSPLHDLDRDLLCNMQRIHDDLYNWASEGFIAWDEVADVASSRGLSFTRPT